MMTNPDLSPRQFADLPSVEQQKILSRSDNRQRAAYLLEVSHGPQLLAQLPPQEVYLMLKEQDDDFVAELAAMASPEQWTAFFDFDCWRDDAFDVAPGRQWLKVLLEGDADRAVTVLKEMNFETLTLLMKKEVDILAGPETIEDEDQRIEAMKRDGGYQIAYRDEERAKLYGALINFLFKNEPDFCRYLLEAVRSETVSMVEESVYQQRALRLIDQGFPDPLTARDVYARIDPDRYRIAATDKISLGATDFEAPAGLAAALHRPGGKLADLLDFVDPAEVSWELACLVNKVATADRVDLADPAEMRRTAAKVDGLLNLAIEWLREERGGGRDLLRKVYCEELFRLGYSLTLQLQSRAARYAGSTLVRYLGESDRFLLNALAQTPPLFTEGDEPDGAEPGRFFRSWLEVRQVASRLSRIEALIGLFEESLSAAVPTPDTFNLAGCQPAEGRELTLCQLFLTSLANRLLGGDFRPDPIPAGRLVELHRLLTHEGRLAPGLRDETVRRAERQAAGSGEFVAACFRQLEEGFCCLDEAALDPRFIDSLVIRMH